MSTKKHIATIPIYGTNPMTGTPTKVQVGTVYAYTVEDILKEQKSRARYGIPCRIRWRNEDCRREHAARLEEDGE